MSTDVNISRSVRRSRSSESYIQHGSLKITTEGVDENNEYIKSALNIQDELIKITTHRDVRKDMQSKIQKEVQNFMKIIISQSKAISFYKGQIEFKSVKPTYAEIIKKDSKHIIRSRSRSASKSRKSFAAIVKPKEGQSCTVTLKDIKRSINPKAINVSISEVRNIREGGIVINTETKEDLDKLVVELESKTNLNK